MQELFVDPLFLSVMVPLLGGLGILVVPGRRTPEIISYTAAALTFVTVVSLWPGVMGPGGREVLLGRIFPGVPVSLKADALGLTFGLLAAGLWIIATVYSSGYVRADSLKYRRRYFGCFALSVGAALGVAFSGDLIGFLLFYELLTVATYPLVLHKQSAEAFAAGRRYLLFALGAGLALTTAAAWIWVETGQLAFVAGGFLEGLAPGKITALFVLLILGCGVKAAVMPLHAWLPAAMVAPTPVSALLHAVAVVKAGVFGCMRMLTYVLGPEALGKTLAPEVLAVMCAVTIVVGSFVALRQDNLKRRLAYSTIVHLSYIVLGAALVVPLGLAGAMLHMVNHGLCKITMFFCAGAIYTTNHLDRVSQLKGVGKRMPWTFAAFTVAALGLSGVPALCGFVGKVFLARGAIQADRLIYVVVMLGGSLLTAAYLLPVVKTAFFDTADENTAHLTEARATMVVPLVATAVLVGVFGMIPFALNSQFALASIASLNVFGVTP